MNTRSPAKGQHPDFRAWTEMLAGISEKNGRLSDLVAKRWPKRSGAALLSELERERSRIARELHAGAGQPLAGIKLHLEALGECSETWPDAAQLTLRRLQGLAEEALGQVRAVSHRLHPPAWQEMKMQDAMESLIEASGLAGSLRLTRSFPALKEEPTHAVKVQMYRVAQECISNVIRHAHATEAAIVLCAKGGTLVLAVTDNGKGFDTELRTGGIGLRAIREHAAALGGRASIDSGPGGTKIVVSLPCISD
jgi:two-component system NarL family sensor kinase